MSDSTDTSTEGGSGLLSLFGERDARFHLFVKVALLLAVVTSVEIVILFVQASDFTRMAALVILSVLKFVLVVYVFMHLRWDRLFCTLLFLLGLSLATGTVAALLAVFRVKDSVPLTAQTTASVVSTKPSGWLC